MGSVEAVWGSRGPSASTFNPTMTVQGPIYHYLEAMVSLSNLRPSFLSVYVHNTDFVTQSDLRAAHVPNLHSASLQQPAPTVHERNHYVLSFLVLRDWATPVNAPNPYRVIIHSNKRPTFGHDRRYKGSSSLQLRAIIPGTEDGIVESQNILIRRRKELSAMAPSTLSLFRPLAVHAIYLATFCFYHAEQMDGILDSNFNLLFFQDLSAHVWLVSCSKLTNSSSNQISSTLFFEADVLFNNTSSIGSIRFESERLKYLRHDRVSYAMPTIRLFARNLKTLGALKTRWMLLARVIFTFSSQPT